MNRFSYAKARLNNSYSRIIGMKFEDVKGRRFEFISMPVKSFCILLFFFAFSALFFLGKEGKKNVKKELIVNTDDKKNEREELYGQNNLVPGLLLEEVFAITGGKNNLEKIEWKCDGFSEILTCEVISIFPEDFYGRVPAAAKLDFSPLVYKDKSPRLTLTASCKNPYVHPSVILENDSVRGELRNLLIFHKCLILEEKVNPYSISFEVESDGRKVFSEIGDFVEKNNLYLSGLKMSRLGSDGAAVLLDFMKVANETADNGTSANETSANETAANAGRLLKSAGSSFFEIKKNRQKSYTGNVQKSDSEIKNKVGEVIKADGERIVYYKDDEGRMKSIVLKEEK